MIFRKSESREAPPGDWVRLVDGTADPDDRIQAMERLRSAGHADELMPEAEAWLRHSDPLMRSEGMVTLMIWCQSRHHLPQMFEILHHDPSWWLRPNAARLLVGPRVFTEDTRDEILRHLVAQLEVDEDEDAQMGIYDALLRALIPHRADRPKLPGDAREWNRARDVDWRLLAPWRTPPA